MLASEPVDRFMSEAVLSIDVSAPGGEILRLFAAYPVHHLPVVDGTKVVGMLSSADVLKVVSFIPAHVPSREEYLDRHINIARLMHSPALCAVSGQTVEEAARLMATHGIHALPVTDRAENLLGIITTTDIMHAGLFPEQRGDRRDDSGSKIATVRVSPAELERALHLASAAAESDDEHGLIASALLHTQARLRPLEHVLSCADRYLHAGQDERLHTQLAKAIERARDDRHETPT